MQIYFIPVFATYDPSFVLKGDIMGTIRNEVERFYMRDYVEERTETRLIEHLSLSDLIFSRNKRVRVGLQGDGRLTGRG
jgi:hypothetical protein